MLQLVISGNLPSSDFLRRHCLADPDILIDLSRRADTDEELIDRFSRTLHDLRMAGAWKRTNRQRLKQTERMLCSHIGPECRNDLRFLDVGASDGITSVEAIRALREAYGRPITGYSADINTSLLRYRRGPIVEYRARDGEPVMVRFGRIGIRLSKARRGGARESDNRLAVFYLRCQRFRRSMRLDTTISLISPGAKRECGLTFFELDCLRRFDGFVGQLSAIRASNVLNLGYFTPDQIELAVRHFHAYLRPGGCLVVSRNIDGPTGEVEAGSVWVKQPHAFRWVEDFGPGSEVKDLIEGVRVALGSSIPIA